jgi:hypothetical protein
MIFLCVLWIINAYDVSLWIINEFFNVVEYTEPKI